MRYSVGRAAATCALSPPPTWILTWGRNGCSSRFRSSQANVYRHPM